ncbi:MAG: LicD family protein [bacterium]|nr:LicD family protein [bacterium]
MNYYAIFFIVLAVVVVIVIGILVSRKSLFNLPNPNPFKSVWSTEDKESVMRTLRNGMRILESHDIEMVAVFGTLIGVLRHKGLIPWDDDLDFAIRRDQKELLFSLKEELAYANIGLVNTGYADWAKLYPLDRPLINNKDNPWSWPFIDIFFYDQDGEDITLSDGSKVSKRDFLPLKKGVFEGISVYIPNNPDKILGDKYGNDWKDVCISSDYNHRFERKQEGGHRAICTDVM